MTPSGTDAADAAADADRKLTLHDRLKTAGVLVAMGFIILGATCGACAAEITPKASAIIAPHAAKAEGRTAPAQWAAAVLIEKSCSDGTAHFGTGVIIGKDTILTAAHVVAEDWDEYTINAAETGYDVRRVHCPDRKIRIAEIDGTIRDAKLIGESETADVARLQIDGFFKDDPAVIGRKPGLGETVCVVALIPEAWRRCGTVQWSTDDQIRFDIVSEHGNSGSAVYDSAGRLVGVLDHQHPGEGGQIVGGDGAALWPIRWIALVEY